MTTTVELLVHYGPSDLCFNVRVYACGNFFMLLIALLVFLDLDIDFKRKNEKENFGIHKIS